MDIFFKPQTLRQRLTATMLASSLALTSFSALVALEAASPGVALAEVSSPSISNIPSSASVGQSFSPLVDRGSSSADFSVSSSTPLICTVAPGGVAYLAPGTCSLTSHLALSQSSIGSGFASSSFGPMGVAVDSSGHVFVADTGNNRIVKMDADGANQSTIGSGFSTPMSVTVDSSGHVFVADTGNNRIVKMDADGSNQSTFATGFSDPKGVAVNSSGLVFVADTGNGRIIKVDADGANQSTIGSGFSYPRTLALDAASHVFVADTANRRIMRMDADGSNLGLVTSVTPPTGIAVDSSGDVYVSENNDDIVLKCHDNGDGWDTSPMGTGFNGPSSLAVDAYGKVYVADQGNKRIEVLTPAVDGAEQSFTVTTTVPGKVSHVKTHATGSKVRVSWQAPSSDGGATIDSYQVQAVATRSKCTATTTTSCTLRGLNSTHRYTITIKAHNANGWSVATKAKRVKG
jgi:streptogramin lyase